MDQYSDVVKNDLKEVEMGGMEARKHYALLIDKDRNTWHDYLAEEMGQGQDRETKATKLNKTTTCEMCQRISATVTKNMLSTGYVEGVKW